MYMLSHTRMSTFCCQHIPLSLCNVSSGLTIVQVVLDSAEKCFTQFLIEMVVNKGTAEFGAACELLLVREWEEHICGLQETCHFSLVLEFIP